MPASDLGVPPGVVGIGSNRNGLWVQLGDGSLWAETDQGFEPASLPPAWPPTSLLFQWLTVGETNVLVGDSVVVRYGQDLLDASIGRVPLNAPFWVTFDHEGNLWAPTSPEGIARIGSDAIEWYALPEEVQMGRIRSSPTGALWASSASGLHAARVEGKDLVWTSLRLPSVTGLEVLGSDSVMVGTLNGAFLVTGVPPRVARPWGEVEGLPSRVVTVFARETSHSGWIGTSLGACHWDAGERQVSAIPGGGLTVTALLPDEGGLWIGTWAGLWRWRDGVVTRIDLRQGLGLLPAITALYREPGGRILAGTYSDGVIALRGDTASLLQTPLRRVLSILPRSDGSGFVVGATGILAMEASGEWVEVASFDEPHQIRSATILGDDLWGVTSTTVERWSISGPRARMTSYTGLPEESFWWVEADGKGCLWLLTRHHLCRIEPRKLGARPLPTAFGVAARSENGVVFVRRGHRLELPRGVRSVTLELNLPDFSGGELELRTWLRPLDRAWTPCTAEWVRTFVALPPGEHEVFAQVRAQDGRVTPEVPVAILVIPPSGTKSFGCGSSGARCSWGWGAVRALPSGGSPRQGREA